MSTETKRLERPPPATTKGDQDPRCWRCGKLVGVLLTRPWCVVCPRCNARNGSPHT